MYIVFERVLPPALLWSISAILWYVSVSVAMSLANEALSGICSFYKTIFLLFFLFVVGLIYFGPFVLLFLLLPFPFVAWTAFFDKRIQKTIFAIFLRTVTVVALVWFSGLTALSMHIRNNRPPSEFILQWDHSRVVESMVKGLWRHDDEALAELRIIVEKPIQFVQFVLGHGARHFCRRKAFPRLAISFRVSMHRSSTIVPDKKERGSCSHCRRP